MYYANLDENNYVLSVNTVDNGDPPLESIDEYDFSGYRIMAYRYEDGKLMFDENHYNQLIKEQKDREEKAYLQSLAPSEADLAAVELAEIVAEQEAALCELAGLVASLVGGDA